MSYPPNHEPPTGGWPAAGAYLGDIDQHWDETENGLPKMRNTTAVDSKAGCGGGTPGAPFQIPARTDDPSLRVFRCNGGDPEGPWPVEELAENSYEVGEEDCDLARCRKRGVFTLAAQKIWQGQFGPRSYAKWGKRIGMKGDCSCEILGPVTKPDLVKYLSALGNATYSNTLGSYGEVASGSIDGATVSIGKNTGLRSGSTTVVASTAYPGDPPDTDVAAVKTALVSNLNTLAGGSYMLAKNAYCAWAGQLATYQTTYDPSGPEPTYSAFGLDCRAEYHFDSGIVGGTRIQIDGTAELKLNEGVGSCDILFLQTNYDEAGFPMPNPTRRLWQEQWTTGDDSIQWRKYTIEPNELGEAGLTQTAEVFFGDAYTSAMVNADLRTLARTWLSLGPSVCRVRMGDPRKCPLVSYNEVNAGENALQFASDGAIDDGITGARWPFAVKEAGAILGAPLAPMVMVGETLTRVCYEPYFDFTFVEYDPTPVPVEGGARFYPAKYGAFCDIPYATQQTDFIFQRNWPTSAVQSYAAIRNRDEVEAECGDPIILDGGIATLIVWIEHVMLEKPTHNWARPCGEDRHAWNPDTIRCWTYDGVDGEGNLRVLFGGSGNPYTVGNIVRSCGVADLADGYYQIVTASTGLLTLTAEFTWPQPSARATVPATKLTGGDDSTGAGAPTTGE